MGKAKFIAATMCTGLVALSNSVLAGGFVHDSELDAAGHLIIPSLSFQDRGSRLNRAVGGAPITASDDGDGAHLALIPNLYYAHSYDERLKFGAAVNVPFAFLTDYEAGWQGRYHALRSDGMVINLNASAAYRFNELLSMGVGFNAQYIDVTFSNALDFSALCLGNPASAPACSAFGLTNPGHPATDGHVEFSGDDWSYGYNIGVLLEPFNTTRIGVHYRSHVEHEVGGEADFTVPVPAFAAATGAFRAPIISSVSAGRYWAISPGPIGAASMRSWCASTTRDSRPW